jgi:RimJ/RimL family protein N-acetyltransferase
VEPVEINAGKYYLRALRADDRVDDRPAVLAGLTDPLSRQFLSHLRVTTMDEAGEYIARRMKQWSDETRCSWAVADPLTGDLLGEVLLKDIDRDAGTAEAGCWTRAASRGTGLAPEALAAVLRFGFGALGLREIRYVHERDNTASRRVAEKLGMSLTGERSIPAADPSGTPLHALVWSANAP